MSYKPWTPLFVPSKLSGETLEILLPALVALDCLYLRQNPGIPPLYASGVRYQAEPPNEEKWLTVPFCLAAMAGDCEDLACWRTAELQLQGEPARAVWSSHRMADGSALYHIRCQRADGTIEDPSEQLGMGWEGQYARQYGPLNGLTDPNEPWNPVRRSSADVHRAIASLRNGSLTL